MSAPPTADKQNNKQFIIKGKNNSDNNLLLANKDYITKNIEFNIDLIHKPIEIIYNIDSISFNLFGCWNGMNNNTLASSTSYKNSQSLPILVNMMQQYYNVFGPSFSVVLGDNFYSKNSSDIKTNIDTGFDLLSSIDIPYFMMFGNHDIESEQITQYQMHKSYENMQVESNGSFKFGQWILPGANYIINVISPHNECTIVVIDTNIFFNDEYMYIKSDTKTSLRKNTIKWIESTLKILDKNKPIFVTGHHPFFAFGHKKKAPIIQNDEMDELYDLLVKNEIKFYICADEHNFQMLYDADNDIHHIITGGSSIGDETYTHSFNDSPFSSRGRQLQLENRNIFGKMIINSPHFTNISITNNAINIKIVSLVSNQFHSFDHLKNNCTDTGSSYKYDICYQLSIPKYCDYIHISNCAKYKETIENDINGLKEESGKKSTINKMGGALTHRSHNSYSNQNIKSITYRINLNKIENL
jgi:hypothetical protein